MSRNGLVGMEKIPAHLMDIATRNASSRLLSLPAEIRRMVWEHALGGQRVYISLGAAPAFHLTACTYAQDLDPETKQRAPFSIPSVCRQMYAETATMPYSHCNLVFRSQSRTAGPERVLGRWYREMSATPALRDAVRTVTLEVRPGDDLKALGVLIAARRDGDGITNYLPGLRRLYVPEQAVICMFAPGRYCPAFGREILDRSSRPRAAEDEHLEVLFLE